MSFGGFGQNSGPSAPPRAQIPFGSFARPPSSSPPRPISPSNDPSLRWGDAQTSPFKDHGAQAYQMPHGLLPQVASTNPKTTSFARTAEVQYSERTNSPYSQAPVETSKNSRSVIESDRSHLVRYRGPSPPMVSRNNVYVGGQHPQSEEVQQRPISSSTWGNQSKASSSVLITRGPNQSGPMFQTKYADGLHPKRTRSPTLPSISGVSPEKSVSYSDGHKRSLIDYRDLDAPEAMSSPPLGFESSSSVMVPSRPFTGNRRLSPPDVQASQSKQFQEDMSPVLTTTDAYQSGRMLQTNYAESPLSKRTRSPTTPSTSTGFPQNPAFGVDGHKRTFDFRSQSQSPTPGQTNSTEVSVDGPMHFPALKKTKIPLRSSSDQVFEENLDPSLESERELLAKEKRLARFKDELSQPVQSHSTVRNQKVPAKRQHPSTLGGQKLSEDTMAGMGDAAGGNVSSDYEGVLSSSIIVGLCPDMCPESERAERERKGDLDQYERLDGDRNLTSEFLAVKKYTRTAEREADLIRPMPILQKTMDYLLSLLDEPYDDRFLGLYNFLWDRMRAIRMDLRMQHIFNLEAINLLEQMIRLHIIAMHELCEYTKGEGFSEGFDAHLNIEQMNKTSVELFQLYDDHRKKGIHVPSEREFRGYYALLKLDKHPGYKVEPAELSLDLAKMTPEMRQTPEVLFARDVARACRTGNFIAFFRLARKASYLQACLMHAHFSKLRTQALASLHCGLQMNQGIPITLVAKWLGMEEEDIGNLLEYYGFSVKDFEEPYMVKDNAFMNVENDFPVKRSKLVNRKRSTMIVRDVSLPSQKESYSDEEVKLLQPKKVPEPIPKPSQSVVPVSANKFLDQEMHDWGTILSPKTNKKNHMDKVSVALTTPEKEMFGQEVQLAPSSPLLVDFSNSSSGHHQSRAEFTHKPKFELVFRNSFGRAKRELETTVPTTPETDEENGFPVIPLDSVVHTPIPQPVSSEDLEDEEETGVMEEEETGVMEEDQSEEVTTSYYDKEVEEAKLKLMLRLWKRHTAKKRELRERKQLTADAALSSLSMGPPIWQFEVQSGSLGTFNVDHVMSERHEIQARSWSVVNPSEVVAPKLVEKNPDFKCLCWKLVLFSNKETSYVDNIEPQNETAVSTANSWLHSKLMPIDNNDNDDLLVSSPGLAIWKNWVPNESGIDLTCCLSVIKSIKSEDQSEAITGASAVLFVLSEHIPMELQKNRLRDYVMLLPPGSHLPLLILSSSSKNESDPSKIGKALGLNEIDKSRVDIFYIVFLKDGDPKKNLDGFLSDEHLREGLEWLASESPPQIFVRGIKTRELVLSHLNFTLEIVDNVNTPNNCILAFNEALDRSVKKVTAAAHANPNGWPCPEIERLDESSDEYRAVAWYLPSIGWSLASKTQVLMRALNDSKLPPLETDICRISIGRDIESQKSSLESCLIEYLAKTSQMMGLALAQKEAGILLQNFTRLELCNTAYYIVPNWVSIFRRIFSWRLMNLTSSEVSTTFVLEQDYFLIPSFEAVDHSESNTFNPHVFQPSLDELIKVGYWPSPQFESNRVEYEAFQRLSPVASDGAGLQTSDDDVVLMENEVSFEDGGSKGYDDHSEVEANNGDNKPMHVAKPTEEADKLSRLLEKCNILQNLIDEKLSFYF